MLRAMGLLDRLRNLIEGPPHISDRGDNAAEVERVRSAEVKFDPDIGPFEDAETAHEGAEPERTPPDSNP